MEIKANLVKELRMITSLPMMACKKALVKSDGDINRAVDILRAEYNKKIQIPDIYYESTGIYVKSGFIGNIISQNGAVCVSCGEFINKGLIEKHDCN